MWGGFSMKALKWEDNKLCLIDQTMLPHQKKIIQCFNYQDVARSIKEMKVRGAPAIGVTAAYGVVLGILDFEGSNHHEFYSRLDDVISTLRETRPTAVNLFWALERMRKTAQNSRSKPINEIKKILLNEAHCMAMEDEETNRKIGTYGEKLIKKGDTILTHCNTGALATVGYGTALGIIRAAHEKGKDISVYVDETRPYLQGARLTAWELMEDGIPVTLITDSMAGYFMKKGDIQSIFVGADRVTANGDVANKIGTYSLAVLAKENGIPFYVAAPLSTLDMSLESGDEIEIEERDEREITHIGNYRIAPQGVKVANPAFDITPNIYITAIITEKGVVYPPFKKNFCSFMNQDDAP
jgi:methylthioribose-1-phosphate isomerase